MRCIAAATLVALLSLGSAGSASSAVVWQGDAVITATSAGCVNAADPRRSIGVGDVLRSVLRPKLVSNNGNDTRLSFLHDLQGVYAVILAGGAMPSGSLTAFGVTHGGLLRTNVGDPYSGFTQSPAAITTSTINVVVTGRFVDFLFVSGCSVSFRAAYTKRVD